MNLRRTLAALGGLLLAMQAQASEKLPDLSGPQDPSQFVARENALRRAINGNFLLRDGSDPILPETRSNFGIYLIDPVADYGAPADGETDASAEMQAALTACGAGGRVEVGYQAFRIATSITIPFGCTLRGSGLIQNLGSIAPDLNRRPALMLDSTATITVQGALENLAIYRHGITAPSSVRTAYDGAAQFAGTAITVATRGVILNNLLIVGFDKCIDGSGGTNNARLRATYIYGDCRTGFLAHHFHDVAVIHDIEFWTGFYSGPAFHTQNYTPSAAANNGSGAIRLTLPANILQTGDRVQITGESGIAGVDAAWTATVIDATHIDLDGSQFAPATTGTWESGSRWVTVASTNSLGIGQTVAGVNVAGGTTVQNIDWSQGVIWLSAATTGAGAGTSLAFTNPALVGDGVLKLDSAYRSGAGFEILDSEGTVMRNVFAYGHATGFHVGTGAADIEIIYGQCDGGGNVNDTICMVVDGGAAVDWNGGWVSSYVNQLYLNGGFEAIMRGVRLVGGATGYQNGAAFASVNSGNLTVTNNYGAINTTIPVFISDSNPISRVTLGEGKYGDLKVLPKNDTARARLCISGAAKILTTALRGTACGDPISWSSASQTVTAYIAPGGVTGASPDFGWYNGTGRLVTLSGIHIDQVTAPGAGKSWAYTVQAGAVGALANAGPTCTVSDAAVSCVGAGTIDVAAGSYFAIKATPTGSPAATGQISASTNQN